MIATTMAFSQAMTVPDMQSMMSHGLIGKSNVGVENSRLPLWSEDSASIHGRASPARGAAEESFTASDLFIAPRCRRSVLLTTGEDCFVNANEMLQGECAL